MNALIARQFFACGDKPCPDSITLNHHRYDLSKIFKHDFFAATALYELNPNSAPNTPDQNSTPEYPQKIVLKQNRCKPFFAFPLVWVGSFLTNREIDNLKTLTSIPNLPKFLSRFAKTGYIYKYIPGRTLDEKPQIPDAFFSDLIALTKKIHKTRLVYLDMNKKGNIILAPDKKPHLIDFQVSIRIPEKLFFSKKLADNLLKTLARADLYHIYKHKRRLAPHIITDAQKKYSRKLSPLIQAHRLIANPLRKLRRSFLKYFYSKAPVSFTQNTGSSPENDPARFLK